MSNYTKTTDFEAKDSLPTGDSGKIIRGAEFETEFDAISTAIATKADTAGPTFTGTLTFETISDGTIGVTAFVDEDDMSSDSATLVPTQQSVKAYVDAQVTAQDLDFQANTGGALSIDLDSETLTFTGGTGIDTSGALNEVTFAIDSTVTTLTGTQTLTNKTLTSAVLNTGVSGTAVLDEDDMVSDSATQLATQQSIKAYVDSQVAGADTLSEVLANGNTTGGTDIAVGTGDDITFADSSKAIFGASSDLQIYHNGSASYITDSGTGNLLIQGTDVRLQNAGATANYLKGTDGAEVSLFYAGGQKLVTTSTGIDVTGTIVGDGLDVDTSNAGNGLNYGFDLKNSASGSATSYAMPAISWANGGLRWASVHGERNPAGGYGGSFVVNTMNSSGSAVKRLDIDSGGDISFYEDTGTTAKFFWDASTERLGIGTASPSTGLHISNTGPVVTLTDTDTSARNIVSGASGSGSLLLGADEDNGVANSVVSLRVDGSEKAQANSTGFDVTGTLTTDTLDVDSVKILSGQSTTPTNDASPLIYRTSGHSDYANGDLVIQSRSSASRDIYMLTGTTTPVNRLQVNGNGDISFYEDTGTTQKFFWDASAESLGIGTTSPASLASLHLKGAGGTELHMESGDGASTSVIKHNQSDDSLEFYPDGSLALTLQSDNEAYFTSNVGIGTSSPAELLVLDKSSGDTFVRFDKSGTFKGLIGISDSSGSGSGSAVAGDVILRSQTRVLLDTGGTTRAVVDASGNVGIGTSSPSSLLDLSGTYPKITLNDETGVDRAFSVGTNNETFTIRNETGSADVLAITNTNNVGFGTASPEDKAHINGGNVQIQNSNASLILTDSGNSNYKWLLQSISSGLRFYNSSGSSEAMRIDSSGNVGIGESSPQGLLHVDGFDYSYFSGNVGSATLDNEQGLAVGWNKSSGGGETVLIANQGAGSTGGMVFATNTSTGSYNERMRIDSSGRVGIGTSSPINPLHVATASTDVAKFATTGAYTFVTLDNATRNWALSVGSNFDIYDRTAASTRMSIDSSGQVGIGTSPSRKLHVNSAGTQIAAVFQSASTNSGRIALMDANTTADNYVNIAASANALAFYTGASETVRISSGGNLLVGKTSDDNTTTGMVVGGNGFTKIVRTSGTANVNTVLQLNRLATDGEILRLQKDGSTVGSISVLSNRLYIGSGDTGIKFSGADDLISPIDASDGTGRDAAIDLGSSSTRFKDLHLSGTLHGDKYDIYTEGGGSLYQTDGYVRFANGSTETARIDSSGNLLVGTTDTVIWNDTSGEGVVIGPNAIQVARASDTCLLLNRQSTDGILQVFASRGVQVGSVSVTTTATTYNTSSDQRLKNNIVDAPSASDDIDAIQVRSFDWKADGSHQKYGMVAQELQSVVPEAVSQGETEEDMMGVDYSKLVPMMLKEIQSLRARVAQLEGEN